MRCSVPASLPLRGACTGPEAPQKRGQDDKAGWKAGCGVSRLGHWHHLCFCDKTTSAARADIF
jgi:hypothetical protein